MTFDEQELLRRFHRALVREIHSVNPEGLQTPFTVAEIYQNLVPYRTHRDELGVEMNADYEYALLRLLAGEGEFLVLESETARTEVREELDSPNPNTGLYRDFAAADVRLNAEMLDVGFLDEIAREAAAKAEEMGVAEDPAYPTDVQGDPVASEGIEGIDEEDLVNENDVAETVDDGEAAGEGEEGMEDQTPVETCPWCRENLPQRTGVRFCPFCGSNVQLVPCPACGEELELNWRFCIACGTEVAP